MSSLDISSTHESGHLTAKQAVSYSEIAAALIAGLRMCPRCPPWPSARDVIRRLSHAPDLLLIGVLLEARVEVLPPLEEHRVADQFEPGGELEGGVGEELLQFIRRHVLNGLDLVLVDIEVDVSLDEEDIVDCNAPLVLSSARGKGPEWALILYLLLSCSPHWPLLGAL